MKIPKEIVGQNKIKNAYVCKLYVLNNLTQREIGQKVGLTQQAIGAILYKNRHLLQLDKNYEKQKRINKLKYLLEKYPSRIAKKSTIDILEQLRKEFEGDRTNININTEVKTIFQNINITKAPEELLSDINESLSNQFRTEHKV